MEDEKRYIILKTMVGRFNDIQKHLFEFNRILPSGPNILTQGGFVYSLCEKILTYPTDYDK